MNTRSHFNTSGCRISWMAALALAFGIAGFGATAQAQLYISTNAGVGDYDLATDNALNSSIFSANSSSNDLQVVGNIIYFADQSANTAGAYDATTGALIDGFTLITGLNLPTGLLVVGNDLFIANHSSNAVAEYDATTGALINSSFISVDYPSGIAISGSDLYVLTCVESGSLSEYDVNTGALINSVSASDPNGIAVSGTNLYVSNSAGGSISEFNAATLALENASFVTGLNSPIGLAVSGSNLYVADTNNNRIGDYATTTGAAINATLINISAPDAVAIGPVPQATSSATATGVSGTAVPGSTVTVTLTPASGSPTVYTTSADSSTGAYSVSYSALSSGTYSISVVASEADESSTPTVTCLAPPAAPAVAPVSLGLYAAAGPVSLTGTAAASSEVGITLLPPDVLESGAATSGSTFSITTGSLSLGTYTYSAVDTNLGFTSPATTGTFIVGYEQLADLTPSIGSGCLPWGALIQGTSGALYGTTFRGGPGGAGTVFQVNANGSGFQVLQTFTGPASGPQFTPLFIASNGLIYGETAGDGLYSNGSIFEIQQNGANYKDIHDFTNGSDGAVPSGGLIQGQDGLLYGAYSGAGVNGNGGGIFKISLTGTGFTTIYSFNANDTPASGFGPASGVIQGTDGWLYGTAAGGDDANYGEGDGVIFKVTTNGTGYQVLHTFAGAADGSNSGYNGLIQGGDGMLYGSAQYGGAGGQGTIFKISTSGTGFTLLYNPASAGTYPYGVQPNQLMQGTDGALYCTMEYGGGTNAGTILKLNTDGTGLTLLFDFTDLNILNGGDPIAGLLEAADGNLYGTATGNGNSTPSVFRLNAQLPPPVVTTVSFIGAANGTGSPVPGAHSSFINFGVPSINDSGMFAFKAELSTFATAILYDGTIQALTGDYAPGGDGTYFSGLSDPVLDGSGDVSFWATLKDGNADVSNNSAIFTTMGGTLQMVARRGDPAPGITGATLAAIEEFSMTDDTIFFTATLVKGPGGIGSTNDIGLWSWTPQAGATLLLQTGESLDGSTVLSFFALVPGTCSQGQGRSTKSMQAGGGSQTAVRINFANHSQAEYLITPGIGLSPIVLPHRQTTVPAGGNTFATLSGAYMGLPILDGSGNSAFVAFIAGKGITAAKEMLTFTDIGGTLTPVFQIGNPAPGPLPNSAPITGNLSWLYDPVFNAQGDVAELAVVTGAPSTNHIIMYEPYNGTPVTIAQLGGAAPGVPGAVFGSFLSLALPDNGSPIFEATLELNFGGVNGTNNLGLWAMDSYGTVHLIARTGSFINGKTVRTLTALASTAYSTDVSRSFNNNHQIVYRLSLSDNSEVIETTTVP
ncbi:MAG TPA: choice-of-anchor tandem repeat GloVer-containing protein [Chthoniobacteraceae bacterium]|nr:choice-of-anchor tandem repeat GloVer-containing protein [Chthoniobacteraceae bacterium]